MNWSAVMELLISSPPMKIEGAWANVRRIWLCDWFQVESWLAKLFILYITQLAVNWKEKLTFDHWVFAVGRTWLLVVLWNTLMSMKRKQSWLLWHLMNWWRKTKFTVRHTPIVKSIPPWSLGSVHPSFHSPITIRYLNFVLRDIL